MAASLHFLFVVIKSAILAVVYTFFGGLLLALFLKLKKQYTGFKWYKVFAAHKVVFILLLIFSFTYYGNHGLGDESHIPLGHGEVMSESDTFAYFVPKDKAEQINVQTFRVKGDNLCMSVDSGYKVYNLKTKVFINFSNEPMYNKLAAAKELPLAGDLKDFRSQYDEYWSGWRFWLLP
ncbi:hypothetical protein [Mucilaginibacter celer]|uniref:Uncharacterized protein n=1 Tax=Mucilaginibacter celer TaxID=2305508 RepID=A0A494VIJ1_9SPHI|nr:hypothetical protein [Mucilaginibacter celer]AYL94687.1 hypothetical protein HYN43_004980 [Mucilaginibacter celer]